MARCCGSETASTELRARVLTRISEVRVEITHRRVPPRVGAPAQSAQAFGRLPWLALLFLRSRRLRARLLMVVLLRVRSESASAGEPAVEGIEHGTCHGVRLITSDHRAAADELCTRSRSHHREKRNRHEMLPVHVHGRALDLGGRPEELAEGAQRRLGDDPSALRRRPPAPRRDPRTRAPMRSPRPRPRPRSPRSAP